MSVFVVMMAIMILSSVGVWSLHLSGITDSASGYHRASAQTLYASEMGLVAGSSYLSIPGVADANFAVARRQPDPCWSLVNKTDEFCKSVPLADLNTKVALETAGDTNGPFSLMDLGAQGSLSATGTVDGNFILELTEPRQAFVEGMEAGSLSYQLVTLTSYGIVRPATANFCTDAGGENAAASRLATRAQMIVGPLSTGTH